MRKLVALFAVLMLTALVGCVTINVYFPEAAAQKAADQFIGSVIDQGAQAAPAPKNGASSGMESKPAEGGPSASVIDLLIPAAYAAGSTPDLRIHTPAIDAIHARMSKRFRESLKSLLDEGAIGFTQDGLVAVRSLSAAPLAQRAGVKSTVAAENKDRNQLYTAIAKANGHPEWASQVRETFAQLWIQRAHAGWYYQNSAGVWKRK
ncbi:YdbL family protein [Oleiagrimonas citrea]|jgi:uncharacterized protein|uniref:YdbL family protein n=1 Tax=Oleiagrimonas citrea TaxID=1665687 RepID=A0A846ZNZ4_9GAMM|nr:YdbL family protein [Oleiagrimonas citrea]NKZ39171.1 YdbL family protein [Oleiagrimonas citrea]